MLQYIINNVKDHQFYRITYQSMPSLDLKKVTITHLQWSTAN